MIVLKDLLEVMYDITQMEILARNHDGQRIYSFYFSEHDFAYLPPTSRREVRDGEKMFIQGKINAFGKRRNNGQSEMGYEVNMKAIPKELLDAEVTHILDHSVRHGRHLNVEIAIHELQCETAKAELRKRAYVLTDDDNDKTW